MMRNGTPVVATQPDLKKTVLKGSVQYDEKRSFPVEKQKQQHHMTHSDSKVESMSYMNVVPASPKAQCLVLSLFETLVAK